MLRHATGPRTQARTGCSDPEANLERGGLSPAEFEPLHGPTGHRVPVGIEPPAPVGNAGEAATMGPTMKHALSLVLAMTALGLGCSKDQTPTTPPDATAATPVDEAAADDGDDAGDVDEPADSAEDGGDEPGETAPEDEPESAGPITDEYGAVAVAANPRAEVTEVAKWANMKTEIRTPSGKVFKDKGKAFPYDQLTRLDFDFEGITHTFLVDLSRDGKSKAGVKLTYLAGGEEVVRNYGFDAKLNKREVLRLDDGTALALTISTKTIKPLPVEEREKLKGADGNRDPLSGASGD